MGKSTRGSFLAGVKSDIKDSYYRADLELLDRFINFSAEIARLALAVMAGIGVLLGYLFRDGQYNKPIFELAFNGALVVSFFFLTCALALALAHRYYASDGFLYHILATKHLIYLDQQEDLRTHERDDLVVCIREHEGSRNKLYGLSARFMGLSCLSLFFGVIAAGVTIGILLVGGTVCHEK